jgi:hypothetical protein
LAGTLTTFPDHQAAGTFLFTGMSFLSTGAMGTKAMTDGAFDVSY